MRTAGTGAETPRVFALGPAAFGVVSIAAGLVSLARFGWTAPRWGGLLYDPMGRFLDLDDPVDGVLTGHPFAQFTTSHGVLYPSGINYPPGAVPLLRLIAEIGIPQSRVCICLATALSLAGLTWFIALARQPHHIRLVGTAISISGPVGLFLSLDAYATVSIVVGAVALSLAAIGYSGRASTVLLGWIVAISWSFPVAFALDRMNIDLLVFAVMSATVILYLRHHRNFGAIGLGVSTAMKLYPVIIAVVEPNPARAWRRWGLALASGVGLTVVGWLMTEQSPASIISGFRTALALVDQGYVIGPDGLPYGASGFTGLKAAYVQATGADPTAFARNLYAIWKLVGPLALGAVAVTVVVRRCATWARLMATTTVFLLASPITGDYRLVIIAIPTAMLLADTVWVSETTGVMRVAALTAALGATFAPKTFWLIAPPYLTTETLFGPCTIAIVTALTLITAFSPQQR